MNKYRIVSDGNDFKVQRRRFLFFWTTEQRPEDLDNKDFGGDQSFDTQEKAEKYIESKIDKKWKVIKIYDGK